MADNLDNQSLGNFSIEDTMDMGMGSQELLNDLIAPETSTGNPDDIKEIKDEEPAPSKAPSKAPSDKKEEEKEESIKSIQDFLMGEGDDDDEDDDDAPIPQAKKKEAPKEEQPEEGDEETEVSRFEALANDLFKLGVFTKDEDEDDEIDITSPEEFLERFELEKRKGAIETVNNFIGQFGDDYQKAFDAIFVKGVNPKDYFGTYDTIANFAEMDLADEENQIAVIRQALTDQGFEAEDVISEVERLKNYGDLETVATKHHKVLVKKEAVKLQQLEQKAQNELQQKQAIKQQYYNNVKIGRAHV